MKKNNNISLNFTTSEANRWEAKGGEMDWKDNIEEVKISGGEPKKGTLREQWQSEKGK